MRIEIEVTRDDIERGERTVRCGCPVALAIRRGLGLGPESVDVGRICVDVEADGFDFGCMLPVAACVFVREFDQGYPVEPFTFTLSDEN